MSDAAPPSRHNAGKPWLRFSEFNEERNAEYARIQTPIEALRTLAGRIGTPTSARNRDGTVRGWRVWKVVSSVGGEPGTRWWLLSVTGDHVWEPGVVRADCDTGCEHVASSSCSCGIYGFSSLRRLTADVEWTLHGMRHWAVGEIAAWGRVAIHEDGFRAEFAAVRSLWVAEPTPELLHALGEQHGIEARNLIDRPAPTVPRDLMGSVLHARQRAVDARQQRNQEGTR